MARQATVKHIRKAGAFTGGQLAAGEVGVNTTEDRLELSTDGADVLALPTLAAAMGVVVHGATAGTTRPAGYVSVTWIGSVEPTNAVNNDIWVNTA
jgi:hypothetical protein